MREDMNLEGATRIIPTLMKSLLMLCFSGEALAQEVAHVQPLAESSVIIGGIIAGLEALAAAMSAVLFFPVMGFPLLVLWLVAGGVFFTLRLGFINVRMFGHAIAVVRGKYSKASDPGEVTHFQALTTAVSATVGLGNIAGVAIAVSLGGPGAVIWMVIAGFFGMSAKFAEVALGHAYRKIDENGKVSGGAFYYLEEGLAHYNMPKLGKSLAVVFAIFCIGGSLGGGNIFQSNQTAILLKDTYPLIAEFDIILALVLTASVGIVLIGGIKRIAQVAEAVVPLMALIYLSAALVVVIVNHAGIPAALSLMWDSAFTMTAAGGGMAGALINGFKRAAFSNEAGLGSAPIAHAAAKTTEPVREGCVAILEPFIDTVVICMMTGLVITVTGVYTGNEDGLIAGVTLTSQAFATVIDWFPSVLAVAVLLFAFSTMITWSYYGERAWNYLFGDSTIRIYHLLFCSIVFIGAILTQEDTQLVVDLSDLMMLSMAIPNMIGLYVLSGHVRRMLKAYREKLSTGKF
jgi:AGCS family alanine or glycine:cation symporter